MRAGLLPIVQLSSDAGGDVGGCSATRATARCACKSLWIAARASIAAAAANAASESPDDGTRSDHLIDIAHPVRVCRPLGTVRRVRFIARHLGSGPVAWAQRRAIGWVLESLGRRSIRRPGGRVQFYERLLASRPAMASWLKLVGATDDPMPDPWLTGRADLRREVGFTKRAAVGIGEELVLYAIPQRKIIGLATVASHPIKSPKEERWPWRSKIRLVVAIAAYDRAPNLGDIEEPGGRKLSQSVQRQSHIKLSWREYELARTSLEQACEPLLGDLCIEK